MQKSFEQVSAELGQARIQERRIEEELGRLVQAIADGQPSKSLTTAINDRERELGGNHSSIVGARAGITRVETGKPQDVRALATDQPPGAHVASAKR